MLIDSHCHLEEYYDKSPHIEGVDLCLGICCDEAGLVDFMEFLDKTDNVVGGVGSHPGSIGNYKSFGVERVISHKKIIAIGEIGLEYYYDVAPRKRQIEVLEEQLQLADSENLPVIIHNRESDDDMIAVLRNFTPVKKGVMHCFSSSRKLWEFALGQGFYISFSGIITFNKTEDIQDMLKNTPNDRILIETDSPYLAPKPYRGKPNMPQYVKHVAEKAAAIKGLEMEELLVYTGDNFFRVFDKAERSL